MQVYKLRLDEDRARLATNDEVYDLYMESRHRKLSVAEKTRHLETGC